MSLTRGFMYAGAPRVVGSLWSVSETGTTELMVRFYREMLKKGLRPAAVLRVAQISLMKEKRWSSPFYWASFTLQGEWRLTENHRFSTVWICQQDLALEPAEIATVLGAMRSTRAAEAYHGC